MDLNEAVKLIITSGSDTLLGMKKVEVSRDFIHEIDASGCLSLFYKSIKKLNGVRRQDPKKQYTMNDCMCIVKMDYFLKHMLFHSEKSKAYIMPWEKSVEIDTKQDLLYAEFLIEMR